MIPEQFLELTFAKLDAEQGIEVPLRADEALWPVEAWYQAVRHTPFSQLSALDYSRACEQGIHLPSVIPAALSLLADDILAGDWYDGQLLTALTCVPKAFWARHPDLAEQVNAFVRERCSGISDESIASVCEDLIQKTSFQ